MKLNRVSLNVVGLNRIGLNRIGSPSRRGSSGTDRPYIDPEVLASLKAVCICYGKSNDDPDRAVVKNLVDPDNPFVISNAAYKGMSGFGKYEADFLDSSIWASSNSTITSSKIDCKNAISHIMLLYYNVGGKEYPNIPSFKVIKTGADIDYSYIDETGSPKSVKIVDGVNVLPASYNTLYSGSGRFCGFGNPGIGNSVTITQISSFEGAFVTDGIDDLITSTKTVQEMLGGSNEITVVSMIHQIGLIQVYGIALTNYIRNNGGYLRSAVNSVGKTGIYGYTANNLNQSIKDRVKVINTILGDKKDYMASISDSYVLDDSLFHVQNYTHDGIISGDGSQLAWYWTIIANKVLTTDQINQVIAYFNLDRTLKPDILCNVKKQGITNENHAEFGDKLIDYSGNGRDIQLNNIAWKGDSGIGKYAADFTSWTTPKEVQKTSDTVKITTEYTEHWVAYLAPNNTFKSMKVLISGIPDGGSLQFFRTTADGGGIKMVNGINEIPEFTNTVAAGFYIDVPLGFDWSNLVIEQIPSHAGALCLDGVNDFGKATGMPIYKDYTFIIDYERISYTSEGWGGAIVSKSPNANNGAFISMMANSAGLNKQLFSFGGVTAFIKDDLSRILFWQTKYKSENTELTVGEGVDGDTLWLGTLRDNDSRFFNGAIYSLMSFPYSMSEFLIERQLKKHKLGTLYPDMVEWRPIVKSNVPYKNIVYTILGTSTQLVVGQYYPVSTKVRMTINTIGKVDEVSSVTVNGREAEISLNVLADFVLTSKSPQKIDITIDEYIRYEDIDFSTAYPFVPLLQGISWGDKLKVGDEVTFIGFKNILPDLYIRTGEMKLNGNNLVTNSSVIVEKSMKFEISKNYTLDNNKPKVILSPRLLRIPNASYKILGYIPDISGHGNNGVINNSAYAEGSGVNEDGSYQFDGVDDFVTIPTTVGGGKQVLMKVNWQKYGGILYDQRGNNDEFAIYAYDEVEKDIAYNSRNNGKTYIDGVLNKDIKSSELKGLLHDITITNPLSLGISKKMPTIGTNSNYNGFFSQMVLYDFMLFDEISTEDKIKELNEYVGIEGNTDDLFNETN